MNKEIRKSILRFTPINQAEQKGNKESRLYEVKTIRYHTLVGYIIQSEDNFENPTYSNLTSYKLRTIELIEISEVLIMISDYFFTNGSYFFEKQNN